MDDHILKAIVYLLHQYDVVNLPGLGVFKSEASAAVLHPIEGKMQPPSKTLHFQQGSGIDDGLLYQALQSELPDYSLAELKEAVGDYTQRISEKLSNGEIVTFPQVGRLYTDFQGKLAFLQDEANLNTGSFGLPETQFFPLLRHKDEYERIAQAAATKSAPVKRKVSFSDRVSRLLPILFGLAIIAIGIYIFIRQSTEPKPTFTEPVPEKGVQSRNTLEDGNLEDLYDNEDEDVAAFMPDDDTDDIRIENTGEEEYVERQAKTLPPGQSRCIILVGQFSKAEGVRRTSDKLLDLGYDVYTDKNNGLTRVGAQFLYEDEREVNKALRQLRAKIEPSAFIYKNSK